MTDYIEGLIQTITELRNENAMLQAHIDRLTDEVVKRPTEAQLNSLKSQIAWLQAELEEHTEAII